MNTLEIVHVSDLHAALPVEPLPWADIYFVTGDILPNFPVVLYEAASGSVVEWCPNDWAVGVGPQGPHPSGYRIGRRIESSRESELQKRWIARNRGRIVVENRHAPIMCVRGNHDFTSFVDLFDTAVVPTDAVDDIFPTRDIVCGLRVVLMRGVPPINGDWADEADEVTLAQRTRTIGDDVDILATHSPPRGILDDVAPNNRLGMLALSSYVTQRMTLDGPRHPRRLRAHLFGHIHERGGQVVTIDGTIFSNAATRVNSFVIEV